MAIKHNDGYTLVESIVAMTLFVTVVLGLIGSLGAAFKPDVGAQREQALRLALNELAQLSNGRPYPGTKVIGHFTLRTTVTRLSKNYSVTVRVTSPTNTSNTLLELTKIVPFKYE